ncbi:hypothetical protein PIIN_07878 [Serendipita indica DSM 11827]|uniref:Uncharacterized protein n=1 Tax=Serendipita indica (strain DSM 11827) TaxID=1109443 RepID=G4TRI2_SERID|nr:hypothetical protein PIIN_07878 [Serendipita indica DSM 11827]
MAKGRGGGSSGSGSGSIHDSWSAPGTIKAAMAFEIIYFVVILGEFIIICRRLRLVPPGRYTRAPYILLAIVAGALALSYLVSAIVTRISSYELGIPDHDYPIETMRGLNTFDWFLKNIDASFRPAVCLWLIHLRVNLAGKAEGSTSTPWMEHLWKRIVDWSLVAINFIIDTCWMGIIADGYIFYTSNYLVPANFFYYTRSWRELNLADLSIELILTLNVIVSLIGLGVSQKKKKFNDAISTRLLAIVLPFLIIGFLETLIIPIHWQTTAHTIPGLVGTFHLDSYLPIFLGTPTEFFPTELAGIIISGLCRVGIIGGLLSTMTIPNTTWSPAIPSDSVEAPGSMSQKPSQSLHQPSWQMAPFAQGRYPQYQPPQYPPPTR